MNNPVELQTALGLFDARAEVLRVHRENSLRFEQEYNQAKTENLADDLAPYLSLCMNYKFRYLAEKFDFLWFDTEGAERAFRHFRPEWDFFTPADFEALVRCLLYLVEDKEYRLTQASHDKGIDLCHEHVFQTGSMTAVVRTVIQCKLYRGTVSVADIRDFFGVMTTEIAEGYFFTTGHLTSTGIQFIAKANKSPYANAFRFVGKEQIIELLRIGHMILSYWDEFFDLDVNQPDYESASK